MRTNAVLLVWSIFLHANVVLCGKMMGFRQNAEALVLEKPRHLRLLIVKLKADAFVNADTTLAEVGSIKVVTANGTCLSCDSQAVCSSPVEFLEGSVAEACHGKKWSWKVSSSSAFDIMIQIPLSKLGGKADFGLEITSAVDSSGENSAEQQGRQVRNWVVTTVMGTQDTATEKWLRSAWSKVAVNLNGDFRTVVKTAESGILSKHGTFRKELFAEHCLRPAYITNYIVTELSLTKGELDVSVKCKAAFRGTPKVTECEEDLTPYKLSGCAQEFCSSAEASEMYAVKEHSLARSAFDVNVSCKEPYSGEPEATVCSGDGEPYEVSGCKLTTTTVTTTSTITTTTTTTTTSTSTSTTETSTTTTTSTSTTTETTTTTSTSTTVTSTTTTTSTMTSTTTSTTTTTIIICSSEAEAKGYKVTVTSLEVPTFKVEASCGEGYVGDAKVEACEAVDQPIKLSGCKEIMCLTPSDTSGYVLTESSSTVVNFEIAAECAPLYHGNATAVPCGADQEAYELQGCSVDLCSAPSDTTGYALTEKDLSIKGFAVEAACAEGYIGNPKTQKCSKHAETYLLEGCESTTTVTTTTTSTTETTTSTTTSTITETTTLTTTITETITTTTTTTETSTTTITETSTTTVTSTTTTTETSTTTVTSTSTTTETSTSTSTSTSTTTTTSTTTVTETQTSTTTTTSTSTVTSTSTTTSTITETETSTTTTTTSTTETSTSTVTSTSTETSTTTTTSTTTLTSTTTTSTSTITSTSTTTSTTTTSTSTTTTVTSTTTTTTTTVTSTTTTTTSTITSTTTTVTSTTTLTSTTTTTTSTSTTTTSTSTTSTSTTTTTSTTVTSTVTTTTITSTSTSTITSTTTSTATSTTTTSTSTVTTTTTVTSTTTLTSTTTTTTATSTTTTATSTTTTSTATTTTTTKAFCVAPQSVAGYVVSETNLQADQFAVSVKCQAGFAGSAVATKCNSNLGEYSLSGCRAAPVCVACASVAGYVVTERKLEISNFDVAVSCANGFVGSNPKAIPCQSDGKPYSVQGCEKITTTSTTTTTTTTKAFCVAPQSVAGYVVSETNLQADQFAVSVKCQAGFAGSAVATKCNSNLGEYSLSGCKLEPICVAPAGVAGYVVTERKLEISNFDVAVSCANGFVGSNPRATPCRSDKKPYSLHGCEKIKVCVAPQNVAGYVVSETNLQADQFAVSVKCQAGFAGSAVATKCNSNLGEYSLSGCKPEPICVAPAGVAGYVVTERKLEISNFDVAVSCANGFVGSNPRATPCRSDKKPYSLHGCESFIHCLAPEHAPGYIVNEEKLLAHEFQVTATCAPGYAGKATVARCTADFRQYKLSGCHKGR